MSIYVNQPPQGFTNKNGDGMPASGDNLVGKELLFDVLPGGSALEVVDMLNDIFGEDNTSMLGFTELNPVTDAKAAETQYHDMALQPGGAH